MKYYWKYNVEIIMTQYNSEKSNEVIILNEEEYLILWKQKMKWQLWN